MKKVEPIRLTVLLVTLTWALLAWNLHVEIRKSDDAIANHVYETVQEMNAHGRLPLSGYVGGMVNNIWQTLTGHADSLGCGGQAAVLYNRLQGIPGWHFQLRYETGIKSPIILPHQWVTAYGPHGERMELDPWAADVIYVQ